LGEVDFTTALGRLLRDPKLRAAFRRDPHAAAARLGIRDSDREAVAALDADGVEAQARTLLEKRLHEVATLLPLTFARLGPEGSRRFLEHAQAEWPEGHTRHLEDAASFGGLLEVGGDRRLCRAELNRVRFALGRSRFSVRAVRGVPLGGRFRLAVQVLWQSRTRTPKERFLYLAL